MIEGLVHGPERQSGQDQHQAEQVGQPDRRAVRCDRREGALEEHGQREDRALDTQEFFEEGLVDHRGARIARLQSTRIMEQIPTRDAQIGQPPQAQGRAGDSEPAPVGVLQEDRDREHQVGQEPQAPPSDLARRVAGQGRVPVAGQGSFVRMERWLSMEDQDRDSEACKDILDGQPTAVGRVSPFGQTREPRERSDGEHR